MERKFFTGFHWLGQISIQQCFCLESEERLVSSELVKTKRQLLMLLKVRHMFVLRRATNYPAVHCDDESVTMAAGAQIHCNAN